MNKISISDSLVAIVGCVAGSCITEMFKKEPSAEVALGGAVIGVILVVIFCLVWNLFAGKK